MFVYYERLFLCFGDINVNGVNLLYEVLNVC